MSVAEGMIGESTSALYAAIGSPNSSAYTTSCLVADGEDGLLYYDGFTVYCLKYADGSEVVISVY